MRLIVWCLAIALAGCVGGSDEPRTTPSGTPTAAPTTAPTNPTQAGPVAMLLSYSYEACAGYEAFWPVPLATGQAALPEGYTARATAGTLGETATLRYLWMGCDFYSPVGQVNATVFGMVSVAIEPPADAQAGVDAWYLMRMLTQDDVMVDLWTTSGYDVYTGIFSNSGGVVNVDEALQPGYWRIDLGEYQTDLVSQVTSDVAATKQAYYAEVAAGRLVWTGTFTVEAMQSATGTVTPAPDDPFAEAIGEVVPTDAEQRVLRVVALTGNDLYLFRAT